MKHQKKWRQAAAGLLAVALLVCAPGVRLEASADYQDELDDLSSKYAELEKKNQAIQAQIDKTKNEKDKKLAEKKREALYEVITTQAVSWSVTRVEAWEIDEMDILNARMLAMQRAIEGLSVRPDTAFIDGNRDHGSRYAIETPHQLIVGGDGKSASIAAASILAKVSRDRYVSGELDAKYPQYQFAKHKGYGTKLHYELLDQYGPCPEHRRSFLKKWEAKRHG